jgi:putative hemolysin
MKLLVTFSCLVLAGCASSPLGDKPAGLANPASTYCVEQGGTVELRAEVKGQVGYCHLSDGRVIEEWTYFRSRRN